MIATIIQPDVVDACCDIALVATRLDRLLQEINDELDDGRLREADIMRLKLPALRECAERLTEIVGEAEKLVEGRR